MRNPSGTAEFASVEVDFMPMEELPLWESQQIAVLWVINKPRKAALIGFADSFEREIQEHVGSFQFCCRSIVLHRFWQASKIPVRSKRTEEKISGRYFAFLWQLVSGEGERAAWRIEPH